MTQPDLSILAPDDDGEPGNLAEVSAGNPNQPIAMATGGHRGFTPWKPTPEKQTLIDAIAAALNDPTQLGAVLPVTARQIFYWAVANLNYGKTEPKYKALTVTLTRARRAGIIPFDQITDAGQTTAFLFPDSGPQDAVDRAKAALMGAAYYLDRQDAQYTRLVVWSETAGMVPQLARVCHPYGVEVLSGGGQPSVDFTHGLAQRLDHQCSLGSNTMATVLQVGDFDPSGLDMVRSSGEDISAFGASHNLTIDVERIAVTEAQINAMGLQTAPAKTDDKRTANFPGVNGDGEGTVQAEAIPPATLVQIVRDAITSRMDQDAYDAVLAQERADKAELAQKAALLDGTEGEPT